MCVLKWIDSPQEEIGAALAWTTDSPNPGSARFSIIDAAASDFDREPGTGFELMEYAHGCAGSHTPLGTYNSVEEAKSGAETWAMKS